MKFISDYIPDAKNKTLEQDQAWEFQASVALLEMLAPGSQRKEVVVSANLTVSVVLLKIIVKFAAVEWNTVRGMYFQRTTAEKTPRISAKDGIPLPKWLGNEELNFI